MKSILSPLQLLTVLLANLLLIQSAHPALVTWSGVDALANLNTNWSDANNWSGGTPGAANSILFTNLGTAAAVSNIDNLVDANTTILQLKYANLTGYHTTLIEPGATLTVTNIAAGNLMFVGSGTDAGSGQIVDATVTGPGGQLVVSSTNVGSLMVVQQGASATGLHTAILDLSGLDMFNLTAGRLLVAGAPGSGTLNGPSNYLSGTFYLAKTNSIRLNGTSTPVIDLGDAVSNGGTTYTYLGQTNAVYADTITVGRLKANSTLAFNPALVGNNPVLFLNGNSASRVTGLAIGDFSGQTSSSTSTTTGTLDLSAGTVNALVNNCYVGRGQTDAGAGTATGTLTIGAGLFNVNSLYVAYLSTSAAVGKVTGTVNVTNGTLVVMTNLVLGYNPGASATTVATLNLSNSVVYANAIISSNGATTTIAMTGGTLAVTNTAGTTANPISTFFLGSATLQIPAGNTTANVVASSLDLADSRSVVNVSSLPVLFGYPTSLPLISYASLAEGSAINLGTLPGTFKGYISNDLSSTIWLVVTNGPSTAKADEWGGGVNNLWNTTTLNWTNAGAAVKYSENDSVTFDDLGRTNIVNLVTNHTPLAFIVTNNVLNYTLTGTGCVTGVVGLNKQGSASLTLAETGGDSFAGGIVVGGGTVILDDTNCTISGGMGITNGATLQIGANDVNGTLPTTAVDDEGTLVFSRADNVLVTSAIFGSGGLSQNGNGTLTLGTPPNYTGNTVISRGTLALTNNVSLSNSISLLVSNATFDLSNLAGQTTTLNSLIVTNATFNVALPSAQPPISVLSTLTADGIVGVSNKINVLSLPIFASYPVTLTVIQTANPITLTAGNFNFAVGTLPTGSAGFLSKSADGTSVLLTLTGGPVGIRPSVVWSGADIPNSNTNWSDRLNWQFPGVPTPVDYLIFNSNAAVSASVLSSAGGGLAALSDPENFNNIVNANFTVSTLIFTNLGSTYHNMEIVSGATLTVTNILNIGAINTGNPVQQGYVTISGAGGTLSIMNTNAPMQIWDGDGAAASTTTGVSGSQATLDMSALDNFTGTIGQLVVGASAANTINYVSGILYLAKTNNFTATFQTTSTDSSGTVANAGIVVGDCQYNTGLASYLYLGQANTISADTISIGRTKSSGTLTFDSIYPNNTPYPWVTFQGLNGNPVSLFEVGGGDNSTGTTTLTADANLIGGFVTAVVNTLNIGIASSATSGSGTTTGSLEFDAGSISANTVNVGYQPAANTSKIAVGTISVNANSTLNTNATLSVSGNLSLAVNANSTTTSGALNITGGTVLANNIVAGANNNNSTVTLNGGFLAVTNAVGSLAAPLATLNLEGGTLQLSPNASGTNVVATTVNINSTTTINIAAVYNVAAGAQQIPLINYTGSDPTTGNLVLGSIPTGFSNASLVDDGVSLISLVITAPAELVWSGALAGGTLDGNWNTTDQNWLNGSSHSAYANPELVQFDDTASNATVNLAAIVSPANIYMTNNVLNYVFNGSGVIMDLAGFTKTGAGSLTLADSGADNFSGGIAVNQGSIIFARTNNLTVLGVISGGGNVVQSGSKVLTLSAANSYSGGTLVSSGTLQLAYNNPANGPELAAGAGTITNNSVVAITNGGGSSAYMQLTNTITGAGAINLPANQEISFNGSLSAYSGTINIPAGAVTTAKGDITATNVNLSSGAMINVSSGGTLWVANSGVTVPAAINLIGAGNAEGWGALRVDTAGTYSGPVNLLGNAAVGAQNTSSGTISGVISDGGHNYSLTKLGSQTIILTGANTYGGGTIISNTTLQIGNGLVNGTLPGNAAIAVTNATLSFVVATNTTQTCSGIISGTGSLLENGFGGTLVLNGMNTFTNGVSINAGALWITNAAALGTGPKLITADNGTTGHPELHLNGISGNITLPSSISFITSWIGGGGSQGVLINEAGNNEIDGNFNLYSGGGGTAVVVNGGTLKLAGNLAPSTTLRTLQFSGAGNGTVSGVISDSGTNLLTAVTVAGPATWTFAGTNTYVTNTTVSGGTLLINGAVGSGGVTVQTNATLGGSGAAGGVVTVQPYGVIQGGDGYYSNTLTLATLNLGNVSNSITYSHFTVAAGGKVATTSLNVSGTNVVQILDSSLKVGTNTLFTYTGTIGGTNGFGGFQLGTLPSGVTAQLLNLGSAVKLAVTSVVTVNTNSPVLTNSISGNTLTLSWPTDHLGWRLQVQTNSSSAGLGTNWFTWPNSTNLLTVPVTLNPANPSVFFRLVYP